MTDNPFAAPVNDSHSTKSPKTTIVVLVFLGFLNLSGIGLAIVDANIELGTWKSDDITFIGALTFVSHCLGMAFVVSTRKFYLHQLSVWSAIALNLANVLIWLSYILSPNEYLNSAGQMHIFLFPILFFVVALLSQSALAIVVFVFGFRRDVNNDTGQS